MRSRRKEKSAVSLYAAGLLALAGLIAAAFFAPQIVFRMQDSILCRDKELGVRESTGFEALNTAYEKSLGRRLRNFAEGLAGGENYYVAVQELEVDDEIDVYVHSESALYSAMIQALVEGGLFPYDFWISSVMVRQWKQYVIYSDDYAKGVNFILWYVETELEGGAVLKLLADAEDGTVYAVKFEKSENVWMTDKMGEGYLRSYADNCHVALELWYFFASNFRTMAMEEAEEALEDLASNITYETEVVDAYAEDGEKEYALRMMAETAVGNLTIGYYLEGDKRMRFRLPCGEATLDVIVEEEDSDAEGRCDNRDLGERILSWEETQRNNAAYHNILVGIQAIYEMIPEFA